jgi:ABC-2 type transport system permease protein
MPVRLQTLMQIVTATHFVSFAQAVLFSAADLSMVWPALLKMFAIGSAYMAFSLFRFRRMLAAVQ